MNVRLGKFCAFFSTFGQNIGLIFWLPVTFFFFFFYVSCIVFQFHKSCNIILFTFSWKAFNSLFNSRFHCDNFPHILATIGACCHIRMFWMCVCAKSFTVYCTLLPVPIAANEFCTFTENFFLLLLHCKRRWMK